MFCSKCGKKIEDNSKFCTECGAKIGEDSNSKAAEKKNVPKCTHCGYEGPWKVGPLLRPMDYIIGVVFLLFGIVPGFIYIGVVAAIRSNEDNREKICPKCNAKNLWTFFY